MPARKHVAPELIAEGKYLYEETLTPTDEIGARMGLSRSAFYLRVKELKWQRRRYSSGIAADEAVPSAPAADIAPAPPPADEPVLAYAERMARVRDAELRAVERTLNVLGPASNAEAERTARILAILARTVHDIEAWRTVQDSQATRDGQRVDETDNDPVPGDIDEFRLELARRIRGFIEARQQSAAGIPGEPEASLE